MRKVALLSAFALATASAALAEDTAQLEHLYYSCMIEYPGTDMGPAFRAIAGPFEGPRQVMTEDPYWSAKQYEREIGLYFYADRYNRSSYFHFSPWQKCFGFVTLDEAYEWTANKIEVPIDRTYGRSFEIRQLPWPGIHPKSPIDLFSDDNARKKYFSRYNKRIADRAKSVSPAAPVASKSNKPVRITISGDAEAKQFQRQHEEAMLKGRQAEAQRRVQTAIAAKKNAAEDKLALEKLLAELRKRGRAQ